MAKPTPSKTSSSPLGITITGSSPLASMLSPDTASVRQRRALALVQRINLEQSALVTDLQRRQADLRAKLEDLSDLAPDDTTSLKFGSRDFDPKQWVKEVQEVKLALVQVDFELDIAQTTLKELTQHDTK